MNKAQFKDAAKFSNVIAKKGWDGPVSIETLV